MPIALSHMMMPAGASAACRAVREMNRANGETPAAFVLTFGCQQNEADSEKLMGLAESMGYRITDRPEEAELILVNTCAIREHAEQKALSIIGQYKHLKAARPGLLIGICGCMVAQAHRIDELKMRYPYVDFTLDAASLHRLPEMVLARRSGGRREFPAPAYGSDEVPPVVEGLPVRRDTPWRAWLSIMYGCNNFCSYCIVPYVRGRERSRAVADIEAEARALIADGCRDITLLGQNVNSFGRAPDGSFPEGDFASLIGRLAELDGDFRLRFMTSHPKDASDALIATMAKHEKIARHFHLPLQSGSDAVLSRMNRRYTAEHYYGIVERLRAAMPDITLTTDIIVGFPGETEEDFAATLDMLSRVQFDMIYSFIYSPRKGTPAAEYVDQVPDAVKHERFDRLIALQNEISYARNRLAEGQTLRVLCDGEKEQNGVLYRTGRTDGGKLVCFVGEALPGEVVQVKIVRAEPFVLRGEQL
ncbi:MAG: tRNA (N6-isopentenyl adenosine(37)-C2)-methylthiotransferase MiaB [Clostridia bacterium]|nr:tRNA (N6-isopentenyl adenosine(37)-C2)-methylthiotransferase MiaB [Clostridia bacterium]